MLFAHRLFPDADTYDERTFVTSHNQAAAGGNLSAIQLKNPAASGVVGYVTRIGVWSSLASNIRLDSHGTDLNSFLALSGNKTLGGAAPNLECRFSQVVGAPGTEMADQLFRQLNGDQVLDFWHPIVIKAGEGIVLTQMTANGTLRAHFEWFERG